MINDSPDITTLSADIFAYVSDNDSPHDAALSELKEITTKLKNVALKIKSMSDNVGEFKSKMNNVTRLNSDDYRNEE